MPPEPPEIDTERPNAARMYDYFLGGAHHFAADRAQADLVAARMPEIVTVARANRDFLGRVVTWCLGQGIRQFLDLGSGVPTVGNVHEIAQRHDPRARVAYVDVEPVAGDLELVPPGVVDVVDWPTSQPGATATGLYAAVGRASANPG